MNEELNPKALVQNVTLTDEAMKFQTPCAICISGGSQSGKSTFIVKLIQNREQLFNQKFVKLYYCQPSSLCLRNNPIFEQICQSFPNAELHCDLPDVAKLNLDLDSTPKCVIIDDLMGAFLDSPKMIELVSVQIHHCNITVIFTLHNYFASSRFGRTFTRNLQYKVFFYNRLDLRELKMISSQIGHQANFLQECFNFLLQKFPTESPYILIDGHVKSPMKSMFVRTHIFPNKDEMRPIIFFPE